MFPHNPKLERILIFAQQLAIGLRVELYPAIFIFRAAFIMHQVFPFIGIRWLTTGYDARYWILFLVWC